MSWWVSLVDPNTDRTAEVESFEEGGTYVPGGSAEASLNVTYNYSRATCPVGFHFKDSLDGKVAQETIAVLQHAVDDLGTKRSYDYWEATPGNAGFAIAILLRWAKQHPTCRWNVN